MDIQGANLFFQLIARRYEKTSTVFTSNKTFSQNLAAMRKDLPVFFIAGGDDPVGSYGKGVRKSADAFRKAGMTDMSLRIYPLGRHEILNEINKDEVYQDVLRWICEKCGWDPENP